MQRIISVMGMAGSGKSTLCKELARELGWRHVATGDVIRDMAKKDPEIQDALDAGQFAPREKMNAAMRALILESFEIGEDLLIDGYPRYEAQLNDLTGLAFGRQNVRLDYIIVGCNSGVAIDRLVLRQREDDTLENIKTRLSLYNRETWPVIERVGSETPDHVCHTPIGEMEYVFQVAYNFIEESGV